MALCARVGRRPAALAVLCFTLPLGLAVAAEDKESASVPRAAPLTSTGRVVGAVIDLETGHPIPGATVSLDLSLLGAAGEPLAEGRPEPGATVSEKPAGVKTGPLGAYSLRARLGWRRSRLHLWRLISSNVLALLNPRSVRSETASIEVTSLPLRVEREGYKPFRGVVQVAESRPQTFSVTLRHVFLAPEGSERRSCAPDGWLREQLVEFTASPRVARPGGRVTLRATYLLPDDLGIRYRAWVESYRGLVKDVVELEPLPARRDDGLRMTFERTLKVPARGAPPADRLRPGIDRKDRAVLVPDPPEPLVLVVQDEADLLAAELTVQADDRMAARDYEGALELAARARAASPRYRPALLLGSRAAFRLRRWGEAERLARECMEAGVEGYEEALDLYAEAALEMGAKPPEALRQELQVHEPKQPEKGEKRPEALRRRAEGYWNRAMGRVTLALGDLEAADLHLDRAATRVPTPRELLMRLRLARARAASEAEPESPEAASELARALLDAGQREAALAAFRRAAALQPEGPWKRLDLASALTASPEASPAALREAGDALQEALRLDPDSIEAQAALGALLLRQHRYAEAVDPLRQALRLGDVTGQIELQLGTALYASGSEEEGLGYLARGAQRLRSKPELRDDMIPTPLGFFYEGPKRRGSAGFQSRAAQAAYQLLRASRVGGPEAPEQPEQDGAALALPYGRRTQLALSLAQLGAGEPALKAAAEAEVEEGPSPALARARALAFESLGRRREARRAWADLLKQCPEDAAARRRLAALAAREEGPAAAAAVLAAQPRLPLGAPAPAAVEDDRRMTLWD